MLKELLNVYTDFPRHWCPYSERYTGCDSLLTAIDNGWTLANTAFVQHHWFHERLTPIYYFYLLKDGELIKMRVIENPYLVRILRTYKIKVLPRHVPVQEEPALAEPALHR